MTSHIENLLIKLIVMHLSMRLNSILEVLIKNHHMINKIDRISLPFPIKLPKFKIKSSHLHFTINNKKLRDINLHSRESVVSLEVVI